MMAATSPAAAGGLRERILSAAYQCFLERGFKASTMHEIAKRAGMSEGNLYNYFAGKGAIIDEMTKREIDRVSREVDDVFSGCVSLQDRRRRFYEWFMRQSELPHVRLKIELMEKAVNNERLGQIVRRYDAQMRELIKKMHRRCNDANLSEQELDVRVEMDMALCDGLTFRRIFNPDMNRERTVLALANTIVH